MNKPRIATRKLTELALLTAAALVLGYVEYLIPISGVPGVKLGLSNMVLLYAVALLDKRNACLTALSSSSGARVPDSSSNCHFP